MIKIFRGSQNLISIVSFVSIVVVVIEVSIAQTIVSESRIIFLNQAEVNVGRSDIVVEPIEGFLNGTDINNLLIRNIMMARLDDVEVGLLAVDMAAEGLTHRGVMLPSELALSLSLSVGEGFTLEVEFQG
jgi:hypothetical protein